MISRALHHVDILGMPAILNFAGKKKSSSKFGGICSLLFFIYAIWAIYTSSVELISRTYPQTTTSEVYSQDPREFIISPSSFPIGFYVLGPNIGFPNRRKSGIFLVAVTLTTFYSDGNITMDIIPTEQCTSKHFGNMYSTITSIQTEISFCFAQDKIPVQGKQNSPIQQTLYVTILQCQNGTTDVVCASPDEINLGLTGAWLYFVYGNVLIEPNNLNNPDRRYWEEYEVEMDLTQHKMITTKLRHLNVITDSGWITQDWGREEFATVESITEQLLSRTSDDDPLIEIDFEIGKLETNYSRIYKKVQATLAEIAGLINTGAFCLLLLTSGFIRLKLRERLINEVFNVNWDKPPQKFKRDKSHESKKKLKQSTNDFHQSAMRLLTTEADPERLDPKPKQNLEMTKRLECSAPVSEQRLPISCISAKKPTIKQDSPQKMKSRRSSLSISSFNRGILDDGESPLINLLGSQSVRGPRDKHLDYYAIQNTSPNPHTSKEDRRLKSPARSIMCLPEVEESIKTENKEPDEKENESENEVENRNLLYLPEIGESIKTENKKRYQNENEVQNKIDEKSALMPESSVNLEKDRQNGKAFKEDNNRYTRNSIRENSSVIDKEKKIKNEIKDLEIGQKKSHKIWFKKYKKITLSFWEYLLSFVYRPKKLKQKMELLDEGGKNIDFGLDVISLLQKMKEVDKMKALLFDSDQIILFNHLPKPEIKIEDSAQGLMKKATLARDLVRKANLFREFKREDEALDSYEILCTREDKTEVDKKLLEIFDEGLCDSGENSKQVHN